MNKQQSVYLKENGTQIAQISADKSTWHLRYPRNLRSKIVRGAWCVVLMLLVACVSNGNDETATVIVDAVTGEEVTVTPTATVVVTPEPPKVTPTIAFVTGPPAGQVTSIQLERILGGLRRPTYVTHAGDERLFVAQKEGLIHVIGSDNHLMPEPLLNLDGRMATDGSERGLLGMAFHPNFAENGYFYVVYTNLDGNTHISRFQTFPDNPNVADPDSEEIIFHIEQPYGNHNGGQILFGPDGYFYIGLGDGGAVSDPFDNAQDISTLLGNILRIDLDNVEDGELYSIPRDNPFVNRFRARGEVWMYGLRNPFVFSFDRLTDDLYITDVGQDGSEEISFVPAGSPAGISFGWPILEGSYCYQADTCESEGHQLPIFEYQHDEGCAIIGGHVYRGQLYPELAGNYFFADFCFGKIWTLRQLPDGTWERTLVYQADEQISGITQDANGELIAVFYKTGELYRIMPGE